MRRLAWTAAASLLLVAGVAAGAPPADAPGPVPLGADHPLETTDHRPRIETNVAVDPRDPRHVVVSAIQLGASYARAALMGYAPYDRTWVSSDGGGTFRSTGPLPPEPGGVPYGNDPTLAWDPHGPLYASYTAFSNPAVFTNVPADGLYVARSLDGGRIWQRRAHLESFRCSGPDRSTITTDPVRGWVYVTWVHYVEGDACNGTPDQSLTVTRWARSTDGGAHFDRPVDVTVKGETAQLAPAVLPDGTLLVAYLGPYANSTDDPVCHGFTGSVVVARYRPDGRLLGRTTVNKHLCATTLGLSPNGATYTQILFPSIATDAQGRAVVAVIDDRAEAHGVSVSTSTDGGRQWRTQLVSGLPGTSASMPAVAAGGGRFALAWLQIVPSGAFSAVLASSRDGLTWSAPTTLSTVPSLGDTHPQQPFDGYGFGHYLGVAVGRDRVAHVAWPDLRPRAGDPSDTDVWVRSARLP